MKHYLLFAILLCSFFNSVVSANGTVIYVVRHGQTDWNKTNRLQGRSDIPLNDQGRKEAKRAGKILKSKSFAACYSSPMSRAMETASLLILSRDLPILIDERLLERNMGSWEGRIKDEYLIT